MNEHTDSRGPLILLGGENLTQAGEPVWEAIRAAISPGYETLLLIPAGNFGHKPSKYEYRLNKLDDRLKEMNYTTERLYSVLDKDDHGSAVDLKAIDDNRTLYFTIGECGRFLESLRYTEAWDELLRRWLAGAPIIASPGPSVALAQHAYGPMKYKQNMPQHFKYMTGMDLLTECAVIPHFDKLLEDTFPKVRSVLPDDARLIAIRHDGALIIENGICRAVGDGGVDILNTGGIIRRLESGETAPFTELLA